ncbi:MAG: hypothetical protein AAF307_05420 [Pseudomonadota bacterium]
MPVEAGIALLVLSIGILVWVQVRAARIAHQTYRPLATRQPERRKTERPLGTEALDLDEISRTNRLNESLERGQTNWLSNSGFFGRPDTDVPPLADDETYAARFHQAFQRDKSKE